MTAMIDSHGTVANLLGAQATVIEERLGHALDRGAFAGGKFARQGNHLNLRLADGETVRMPVETFDHAMDELMHERYLELVQPLPGAVDAVARIRQAHGSAWLISKACAPIGRTTGLTKQKMEDFALLHSFDFDEVYHDEDPKGRGKLSFFACDGVTLVADNELPILRQAVARSAMPRHLVHKTPERGSYGHKVIHAERVDGIERVKGWAVYTPPPPIELGLAA